MTISKMAMARVISFLSDITCGESCWEAEKDICHCSCGGKNHGINLRNERAIRTAKIDGHRYELIAVGLHNELSPEARELQEKIDLATGRAWIDPESGKMMMMSYRDTPMNYMIVGSEFSRPGNPIRLKYASLQQCIKWREFEYLEIADERERGMKYPAILWRRSDIEIPGEK